MAAPPASAKRARRRAQANQRSAAAETSVEGQGHPLAEASRDSAMGAAEDDAPPTTAGEDRPHREAQKLRDDLEEMRQRIDEMRTRFAMNQKALRHSRKNTAQLLVQLTKAEAVEDQERLAIAKFQLGIFKYVAGAAHGWEGGYEAAEISRLKDRIQNDRQAIYALRRQLKRGKRDLGGGTPAKNDNRDEASGDATRGDAIGE